MRYIFGRCRFDTTSRELIRDGEAVPLSPKVFELLAVLIEARPAVVAKADLMERIWRGTHVVEANLPVLVGQARMALGDPARGPGAIRTHHGLGYSFAADVRELRSRSAPADGPLAWLAFERRRVLLTPGINVVGRDDEADVFVNDASVSRRHATVTVDGLRAVVEDAGSKNGTRVGGALVAQPTPVEDGDELQFGAVRARFHAALAGDPATRTV
ncbi:MAG: FHA domain-containing protein [Acidobacteriota bacterium]